MEDNNKSTFYDLLANSKINGQSEKPTVQKKYIVLSWFIIFLLNSTGLYLGWNYVISPLIDIATISFSDSIGLYIVAKVLTRGLFSVQ
jgi:hypothetical protein